MKFDRRDTNTTQPIFHNKLSRLCNMRLKGNINTDGFNILPPDYITKLPRQLAVIFNL